MDLISLIIVLIIIGAVLYVVNYAIPMDQKVKTVMNVIVIVAVCIWVLKSLAGSVNLNL